MSVNNSTRYKNYFSSKNRILLEYEDIKYKNEITLISFLVFINKMILLIFYLYIYLRHNQKNFHYKNSSFIDQLKIKVLSKNAGILFNDVIQ